MCFEVPQLLKFADRLKTFKTWSKTQSPQSLAAAGFFKHNAGIDDVQCFCCGIRIFDWEPTDDPLTEHLRWSKNCEFANVIKNMCNMKELLDGEQTLEDFLEELFKDSGCDVVGSVKNINANSSDVPENVKTTKDAATNTDFEVLADRKLMKSLLLLIYNAL